MNQQVEAMDTPASVRACCLEIKVVYIHPRTKAPTAWQQFRGIFNDLGLESRYELYSADNSLPRVLRRGRRFLIIFDCVKMATYVLLGAGSYTHIPDTHKAHAAVGPDPLRTDKWMYRTKGFVAGMVIGLRSLGQQGEVRGYLDSPPAYREGTWTSWLFIHPEKCHWLP